MSSVLRSTDPILLETHIKDCLISLRDGATFSALIFGGLLLVSAAIGADIISMLPAFLLMFLLLIPFCQVWSKVLRCGIHLPSFSFWGKVEFVLVGYLLQFMIKIMIYIGTPLMMFAFVIGLAEQLGSAFFLIAILIALSWPLIVFAYVRYQKNRLAKLIGNCNHSASSMQNA